MAASPFASVGSAPLKMFVPVWTLLPESVRLSVMVAGRLTTTAPVVGDTAICPDVPVTDETPVTSAAMLPLSFRWRKEMLSVAEIVPAPLTYPVRAAAMTAHS